MGRSGHEDFYKNYFAIELAVVHHNPIHLGYGSTAVVHTYGKIARSCGEGRFFSWVSDDSHPSLYLLFESRLTMEHST
jgi:hypothetical protein